MVGMVMADKLLLTKRLPFITIFLKKMVFCHYHKENPFFHFSLKNGLPQYHISFFYIFLKNAGLPQKPPYMIESREAEGRKCQKLLP